VITSDETAIPVVLPASSHLTTLIGSIIGLELAGSVLN
jgi:hypothetical protein